MKSSVARDEKIYCPYCQTGSDFYFPFHSRTYYHCPSCDLIFVRRKEDIKTVIAYYQNRYFDDHTEDQMSGQRTNIYRHILELLEGYQKPGALLEKVPGKSLEELLGRFVTGLKLWLEYGIE